MNIQLFDEKDLAAIGATCQKAIAASLDPQLLEDVLFKAFSRALRVVMREGSIQGLVTPAEQTPAAAPPSAPATAEAIVNGVAPGGISEIVKTGELVRPGQRKKYRRLTEILRRCDNREKPAGFVTMQALRDDLGQESAIQAAIYKWIWDKEIDAVIVYNSGLQPTKGLDGGRLFINKQQAIARNNLRVENSTLPIPMRRSA